MTLISDNLKKPINQGGARLCVDNILFLDGSLYVRGWALDGREPVKRLEIRATATDTGREGEGVPAKREALLNVQPGQLRETVAQVFKLDGKGRFTGFEGRAEGLIEDEVSLQVVVTRPGDGCESGEGISAGDASGTETANGNIARDVIFDIGSIGQVRSDTQKAGAADTADEQDLDGVLILTEGAPGGPCRRYRGDHLAEELIKKGVRAEVVNVNHGLSETDLQHRHLVLQRVWFPFYLQIVELFKRRGGKIFFEVDDAIFSYDLCMQNDYLNQMPDTMRLETGQMADIVALCDGIITSTDYLAGIVSETFPDKPVYVNQNVASDEMIRLSETARTTTTSKRGALRRALDWLTGAVNSSQTGRGTQVHRERRGAGAGTQAGTFGAERHLSGERDTVTIGYFSGTNTHNKDLAMIADVLADVLKKHRNARLLLAGQIEVPDTLRGLEEQIDRFDPVDWKELPALIAKADINLVPLEDTTFNKCKSAIKWLEAALVGVPTAATRNEEFSRVVKDGETGLLCDSEEGWREALERLVKDKGLRRKVAEAARRDALEHFTTDEINSNLLGLLGRES